MEKLVNIVYHGLCIEREGRKEGREEERGGGGGKKGRKERKKRERKAITNFNIKENPCEPNHDLGSCCRQTQQSFITCMSALGSVLNSIVELCLVLKE